MWSMLVCRYCRCQIVLLLHSAHPLHANVWGRAWHGTAGANTVRAVMEQKAEEHTHGLDKLLSWISLKHLTAGLNYTQFFLCRLAIKMLYWKEVQGGNEDTNPSSSSPHYTASYKIFHPSWKVWSPIPKEKDLFKVPDTLKRLLWKRALETSRKTEHEISGGKLTTTGINICCICCYQQLRKVS